MKILHRMMPLLATLVLTTAPAAKGQPAMNDRPLPLIPAPTTWEPSSGRLPLETVTRIVVAGGDLAAARQANLLAGWWRQATDRELEIQTGSAPRGAVVLTLTGSGDDRAPVVPGTGDESWELFITAEGATVTAAEPAGLFRGLQALRQLVLEAGPDGDLPCGRIAGEPRFGWRGMLLDSGRHMQDVAFIKDLVDLLALYGFNVLHWHLTEDQGWRLQVPARPDLTEVGAWRRTPDGGRYGGYYTPDDVREVVDYAGARFVTVVPEIELPGHAKAALAAYPELSCTGGPFEVETQWGVHEDVFCAGNEAVFDMLGEVFDHVIDLFPSRYVHIGGDEVPKDRWLACEKCRERIATEELEDVHQLQSWFVGRAGRMLAERDRFLIGWDEILDGGLPAGATVQSWRGTRGAVVAARAGHDAIVSPTSHAYFDYDVRELPLERVLAFDPVPDELEDDMAVRILGGEMNLWTEYMPQDRVHHQLFPRITAMAEALGTPSAGRTLKEFLPRLRAHQDFWPRLDVEAGPASRPVTIAPTRNRGGSLHLEAELSADMRERYGLVTCQNWAGFAPLPPDWRPDIQPDEQSLPEPLQWSVLGFPDQRPRGDMLALVRLEADGRERFYGAPAVLELHDSLAHGLPVELAHGPSPRYSGHGRQPLTDGVRGGPRFDDGHWIGFEAIDLDATIDLGDGVDAPEISIRCFQDANAWIFLPSVVHFHGSRDGNHWIALGSAGHELPDTEQRKVIREFTVRADRDLRYLRVVAENFGVCPDWHPGRGEAAWIFVDEIRVRPQR